MGRAGRYAIWVVVALVGAVSWGMLALYRGETVNAAWMLFAALASYAIAYRFYARFIQRRVLETDDTRATPAERLDNGRDFVPMDRRVLFGHHFAAIAGAGPLVGPILAAQLGFLPGTVWIIVGVILAGAVQDMTTLFFSVRRNGKTLGQMAREEIGPVGGVAAIIAVLSIMVILIAVLALVVVNALAESPWGIFSITMTLPIAIFMGIYLRFLRPGRVLEVSLIGVGLLILAIIGGGWISESSPYAESWTFGAEAIAIAIIAYGFVASVLPVWLLLAPRDYLSAFMKIGVIGLLAIGIVVTLPEIQMPRATEFAFSPVGGPIAPAGPLFPFVFITIACGALSGFHALVASGTTPKLIQKESQVRMIGYGAMLTESFVAVMAMIAATTLDPGLYFAMNAAPSVVGDTVQSASQAVTGLGFSVSPETLQQTANAMGEESLIARTGGAPTLAVGMAQIFAGFLGGTALTAFWYHFAIMFEALFILTTVDAGTRVGRFMIQDMIGNIWRPFARTSWLPGNIIASGLIVAAWGYFLYAGVTDPLGGINQLFPLFGIANQLLAAVALTVGTTILIKMGKLRYAWITALPLAWDVVVTLTASAYKIFSSEPRIGFFTQFADARASLQAGEVSEVMTALGAQSLEDVNQVWWNTLIDGSLSVLFAVLIIIVIADAVRVWVGLIRGRKEPELTEAPYEESHLDVDGRALEPVGAGSGSGRDA